MKKIILKLAVIGVLFPTAYYAQTTNDNIVNERATLPKPYNEDENAEEKIKELIVQAKKENKNIILQAGGNWCIWCRRFDNFINTNAEIKQIIDENYLYYHLNFSPKNKNEKVFAKYGEEGRKIGYPHFFVLNENGERLHIQESGIFEEGKGYSLEKVKEFFETWVPKK